MEDAPKLWRGRFLEDFAPGDVFRSRLGRTITETDNTWFTCLTMNTNQMHFNTAYAERTRFGKPLVNSCLTLSLVTGLSVPDTSLAGRRDAPEAAPMFPDAAEPWTSPSPTT